MTRVSLGALCAVVALSFSACGAAKSRDQQDSQSTSPSSASLVNDPSVQAGYVEGYIERTQADAASPPKLVTASCEPIGDHLFSCTGDPAPPATA